MHPLDRVLVDVAPLDCQAQDGTEGLDFHVDGVGLGTVARRSVGGGSAVRRGGRFSLVGLVLLKKLGGEVGEPGDARVEPEEVCEVVDDGLVAADGIGAMVGPGVGLEFLEKLSDFPVFFLGWFAEANLAFFEFDRDVGQCQVGDFFTGTHVAADAAAVNAVVDVPDTAALVEGGHGWFSCGTGAGPG